MAADFTTTTHDATRSLNRSHGSFELVLAPVILGLLGLWLDRTVGTVPVFLVAFTVVGFAGAGVKIFYTYRYQMAQHDAEVAWNGHASSAEFRGAAAARAQRLSETGAAPSTAPATDQTAAGS